MTLTPGQAKALGLPPLGGESNVIPQEQAAMLGLPPLGGLPPAEGGFVPVVREPEIWPEDLPPDQLDTPGARFSSLAQISNAQDKVDTAIGNSKIIKPAEAKEALFLSRVLGVGPETVQQSVPEFREAARSEELQSKLSQMPRLASYMARSPAHAASVASEIDQWSTLEYVFGKYVRDSQKSREWDALTPEQRRGWGQPYGVTPAAYKAYIPPGWMLSLGRSMYATSTSVQSWWQSMYDSAGKDVSKIKAQRDIADQPVPGDDGVITKHINSVVGMTPLLAAQHLHPGLAYALMYTENAGRTYEDLRLHGWEHDAARDVGNLIGFTSASIAAAMGPLFKISRRTLLTAGLPLPTLAALRSAPNAVLMSMVKSPTVWATIKDLGKNFLWTMGMNISSASSEAVLQEAFESAKEDRAFNYSKATSRAADAAKSWVEVAALTIIPSYKAHKARVADYKTAQASLELNKALTQEQVEQTKRDQRVYDNYEQTGQALRSIHAASEIVSAVDALKDSQFMRESPEDARELITSMLAPRESQTVYIHPDALEKLSPNSLGRLNPDGTGAVRLVDLLMHPDASDLAQHVAGEPGLDSLTEAQRVMRAAPDTGPRERKPAKGPASAESSLGNDRIPGVREPPETAEHLKAWAEDAVSRRPTSELEALAEAHKARVEAQEKLAFDAQVAATGHAGSGDTRASDEAGAQAREARRQAAQSKALHEAAFKTLEEVKQIGESLARFANPERSKGRLTPREAAWSAGDVYGAAFDLVLENLGVEDARGYAAKDLSDVHDRMLADRQHTENTYDGWDARTVNRVLAQPRELGALSIAEMREVHSALRQIAQASDSMNTVLERGRRVSIGIVENEVRERFQNIPDVPKSQQFTGDSQAALERTEKFLEKRSKSLNKIAAEFNQPHTLFFKLGKIGESLWFDGFVAGQARKERMWANIQEKLESIEKSVPEHIKASANDVIPGITNGRDGQPTKRMRSDVWRLALHLGGEGAAEKIASGLGVKPTDLHEWVEKYIADSPADARLVMEHLIEPHWKIFDGLWEEYRQHFKERGLAPPERVVPQAVFVHNRKYRGGYGGRLSWLNLNERPVPQPGSLELLLDRDAGSPSTDNRSTIERTGMGGIPFLDWNGVTTSLRAETHDIALRPFVEDAHKIFSNFGVRNAMADKMGKDLVNQIYDPHGETDFLHTVARGHAADVASASKTVQAVYKLQGMAAYSAFAGNVRVMLGQFSHIPAAMLGLGISPDHMAAGTAAAFNPERRARAHAASEVLRLRYEDYQTRAEELSKELTGMNAVSEDFVAGAIGTTLNKARTVPDHLNWMAWREMDAFLSHAVWEAAYARATSKFLHGEGLEHDEAVRRADRAVTEMMPAQDIYDQSAFVRDRSMMGFAFMVRNFPNTLYNVAALRWWEARVSVGTPGKIKTGALITGMLMAAEVLGKGAIMQAGPPSGMPEDKRAEWWYSRAVASIFYPLMLSSPALAAYHAAQGERAEARREMNMMTPAAISAVASGFDDVARLFSDGKPDDAYRAAAHLSGFLTKSPVPMKSYDLYNAGVNAEDLPDAIKKGMGYRK